MTNKFDLFARNETAESGVEGKKVYHVLRNLAIGDEQI